MNEPQLEDIAWLTSQAALPWLIAAAGEDPPSMALTSRLRSALSATRTHLVLEQAELRRRAVRKFADAERMFFNRLGLEQATDEQIAAYKASRFPAGMPVADLCCGIGGDLLALARRGPVVGVDRNPAVAQLVAANLRVCAAPASVVVADAAQFCTQQFAACHLDPDRRPQGRRTTQVEWHEPGPQVIDALRVATPQLAIKLAPAATLPEQWSAEAELEWISHDRECRQLVAWFGGLGDSPGKNRATLIRPPGQPVYSLVGEAHQEIPVADTIGRFVYEPDPAVLAAQLTGWLAARHGVGAIAPEVAYLTGNGELAEPALTGFEVEEILPLDLKRLRTHLRQHGIGRLELKQRGLQLNLEQLRRQLQSSGDHSATLLLTRRQSQSLALRVRRLNGPVP